MPLLPSRRLVAVVLLAGTLFVVSTPLALLADAILIGLLLLEARSLYGSPAPEVIRTVAARIPLDGETRVEMEFRSRSARPCVIRWTDDLPAGLTRVDDDVRQLALPPRGEVIQSYTVRGDERGEHRIGSIHLRILGPAGLLWRRVTVAATDAPVVQPGLLELRRSREVALHSRREIGNRRTFELGEGREFERLREYVRGDDTRRIDWKATAKRGQPIVREFAAERSQSIVIAIDAGRQMAERYGGRERLDHALAAGLVLADAASAHGDSVGLLAFSDTVRLYLPPARTPLSRIADALASVRTLRVEPDYPQALGHLGRNLRRRSLVVLFSDVIDTRASGALIAHLTARTRRHLPLLIAMRNVEVEAAARAPAPDDAAAFRRAAAEELLQARASALTAIRRQGVLVSDIRPDDAVAEAVDRYIEIKRRGRL